MSWFRKLEPATVYPALIMAIAIAFIAISATFLGPASAPEDDYDPERDPSLRAERVLGALSDGPFEGAPKPPIKKPSPEPEEGERKNRASGQEFRVKIEPAPHNFVPERPNGFRAASLPSG